MHNIKIMKYDKSPTESLYPSNLQIDEMNLVEAFKFMLNDQSKVISIINNSMNDILNVIENYRTSKNNKSARLIY